MADDLAIPQLAEGQSRPDVTANDASAALAQALSSVFTADLTSGNVSVTGTQYRRAVRIRATGVATTGRTLTLPAVARELVLVESDAANTNDISLIRGSTTLTLHPGRVYLVRTDGTANSLAAADVGGASEPLDVSAFIPGTMANSQLLYSGKAMRAFSLPSGLSGSYFYCGVAVTGSTTVTIKKNGSSIGTATIASGTSGIFTFSSTIAFAIGDVLSLHGPATADASAADFSIGLKGAR